MKAFGAGITARCKNYASQVEVNHHVVKYNLIIHEAELKMFVLVLLAAMLLGAPSPSARLECHSVDRLPTGAAHLT